jgi:hypothetical protein
MVHMQNLGLNRNVPFLNETTVPEFISKILVHEDTYLTFAGSGNNAEFNPLAKETEKETYTCVLNGIQ